jgi:hypothetical protein
MVIFFCYCYTLNEPHCIYPIIVILALLNGRLSYYCNIDIAKWTFIYCRLLCLIPVYLTLGIAIQIFVRKASGKERIPNYSFWVSFPGLVKVG